MRVEQTLFAQGLRLLSLNTSLLYVPDAVREIQERYGFVRVPTTSEELTPMDEGKGLVFQHGKYLHTYPTGDVPTIIRTLTLFERGVGVEVINNITDQCDQVLDDFIGWFPRILSAMPQRMYISQIEVSSEHSLDLLCPVAGQITAMLTQKLAEYGDVSGVKPPAFQVWSIAMHRDPTKAFLPCDFRIERRVGEPYESNVYFSQAPLGTNDHIAVLDALEKLAGAGS